MRLVEIIKMKVESGRSLWLLLKDRVEGSMKFLRIF
jgi:hypothetical protein